MLKSARQKNWRVRFVAGANARFASRWQISLNRKPANGTEGFTSPAACTLLVHATAARLPSDCCRLAGSPCRIVEAFRRARRAGRLRSKRCEDAIAFRIPQARVIQPEKTPRLGKVNSLRKHQQAHSTPATKPQPLPVSAAPPAPCVPSAKNGWHLQALQCVLSAVAFECAHALLPEM